jgi:hypothetical protein
MCFLFFGQKSAAFRSVFDRQWHETSEGLRRELQAMRKERDELKNKLERGGEEGGKEQVQREKDKTIVEVIEWLSELSHVVFGVV